MSANKLTPEQLAEIDEWDRKVLELGTAKHLARKFGVSSAAIHYARKRVREARAQQTQRAEHEPG